MVYISAWEPGQRKMKKTPNFVSKMRFTIYDLGRNKISPQTFHTKAIHISAHSFCMRVLFGESWRLYGCSYVCMFVEYCNVHKCLFPKCVRSVGIEIKIDIYRAGYYCKCARGMFIINHFLLNESANTRPNSIHKLEINWLVFKYLTRLFMIQARICAWGATPFDRIDYTALHSERNTYMYGFAKSAADRTMWHSCDDLTTSRWNTNPGEPRTHTQTCVHKHTQPTHAFKIIHSSRASVRDGLLWV